MDQKMGVFLNPKNKSKMGVFLNPKNKLWFNGRHLRAIVIIREMNVCLNNSAEKRERVENDDWHWQR